MTANQWFRSWFGSDIFSHYAPDDLRPVLHRYGFGVKLVKLMVDLLRMRTDDDDVGQTKVVGTRTARSVAPAADTDLDDGI